jgi:DNA-binding response OmpR family regulator
VRSRAGGGTQLSTDPVLVVDDSEGVRSSVSDLLRSAGYTVLEAEDTQAAIEVLRGTRVGAVVLDVRMPGGGGLAVLETLDDPPPVILMSAFPLDSDEYTRADAKIFVQLVKPFHPRRLLEAVASAMGPADSSTENPAGGSEPDT